MPGFQSFFRFFASFCNGQISHLKNFFKGSFIKYLMEIPCSIHMIGLVKIISLDSIVPSRRVCVNIMKSLVHVHWLLLLADIIILLCRGCINPLTLRAAKRGLTILEIFEIQKHFLENI